MHKRLAVMLIVLATAGAFPAVANDAYYTNIRGHHIHQPVRSNHVPRGASAHCSDGTYSFSENHRGTCSHHGGVVEWLR